MAGLFAEVKNGLLRNKEGKDNGMGRSERVKVTFISAVGGGLLAHLFALVNVLHNYDSITQLPGGLGTGLTSGRWMLELFTRLHQKYRLSYSIPMVNGLVTILLLAFTACIIADLLEIRSKIFCAVLGILFLCYPTVTSTLCYMYTAAHYALAVLLAVLAVWLTERFRFGAVGGILCCAVSMGIYQAYFPMTASLFVILLIRRILLPGSKFKQVLCRGIFYLGVLALGMLAYFASLKAALRFFGQSLSDYQGVDNMGQIALRDIPPLIKRAWVEVAKMPFEDYYGVSSVTGIRIAVLLLAVSSCVLLFYLLVMVKRSAGVVAGCIILCLIFPVAVNSIVIMCPNSRVYTLMVYASVFVYLVPVVLADMAQQIAIGGGESPKGCRLVKAAGNAAAGLLIFVSVVYIWLSNGNYTAMYYNTEQTKNYLNSLATQVRMTEGYTSSLEWAFIGNFKDPTYLNEWKNEERFIYRGNGVMQKNLLMNYYSRKRWIEHYMGCRVELADPKLTEALEQDEFVKNMPCYPDYGSIVVYQGAVVIKLS